MSATFGRVKVADGPEAYPVTLQELKDALRITSSSEDDILNAFIASAVEMAENYTGRKFITQTLHLWLDGIAGREEWWDGIRQAARSTIASRRHINLPWLPLQSVTAVSSFDESDNETSFAASNYLVDAEDSDLWGRLILNRGAVWPSNLRDALSLKVVYVVGYGDAGSDVPASIRRAILMLAAFLYAKRGDCPEEDECMGECGAKALLNAYRVRRLS